MPMDSHDCLSDSESCRVGVHAALAIWHLCHADPFGVLQCAGKDTAWLGLGVCDRSAIADRMASGGH